MDKRRGRPKLVDLLQQETRNMKISSEINDALKMPSAVDIVEADKNDIVNNNGDGLPLKFQNHNIDFDQFNEKALDFLQDTAGIEIVSVENSQTISAITELTELATQETNLKNEQDLHGSRVISISSDEDGVLNKVYGEVGQQYLFAQRSEASLSVRSEMCSVSKSCSSKTKENGTSLSRGSCFELHHQFGEFQNLNADRQRSATMSLEILHKEPRGKQSETNGVKFNTEGSVSALKNTVLSKDLSNGRNRISNNCLVTGDDEACSNPRITSRWRSLSLSQNCNYYEVSAMNEDDSNAVRIGKAEQFNDNCRLEKNSQSIEDHSKSLSVQDFMRTDLHNGTNQTSDSCLVPQNYNYGRISAESKDLSDTIFAEKVFPISENDISTLSSGSFTKHGHNNPIQTKILLSASKHRKTPVEKSLDQMSTYERSPELSSLSLHSNESSGDFELGTTPVSYMMRSDTDHIPGSAFNQTQISREEYVKDKKDIEQKAKELPKDELKNHSFVTQHTVIYPVNQLEMQCFPNKVYQFKYEDAKDIQGENTRMTNLCKDQYSQTKESIVTQSLEDTSRAVSVLSVMLQRRLNNSGSQNGSFVHERLNSFYSTPSEGPKSPSQKILDFQDSKTGQLNDFIDRSDAPLPSSKYLPAKPEADKAEATMKWHYEFIGSRGNFLKEHNNENSCEKISHKSGTDDRSTIRDRLPRGQTRKLASLFEAISDAASIEMLREMDHLKRRGKSVPASAINTVYHQEPEVGTRKLVRDDLNLQRRLVLTRNSGNYSHLSLKVPYRTIGFEGQCMRDKRVLAAHRVRNIVDRFESVSAPNKDLKSEMIEVGTTPRKPWTQKRCSQYAMSMLQPIAGAASYKNHQNGQYIIDSNRNLCSSVKSSSLQSDEWNEYSSSGSPSRNLPHDITTCANVWDQQQYELGLRKGITSLKRYDSNYSKIPSETSGRELSCPLQTHIRQMNYHPEIQSSYYMNTVVDRSQERYCEARVGTEVVDDVAEVEKAFDFVNKTESLATTGQQCSQESLGKLSSPSAKAGYSISSYRDLEREHRKSPTSDVPVRFSPAVYSPPPSAGERLEAYEHKNSVMKNTKPGDHVVTTDPVATSTPVDGSPAAVGRMHTSTSHVLNRSGISSITTSTAQEIAQSQRLDVELETIKQEIMIQKDQIAQASLALTHCKKNNSFNGTLVELSAQRGLLLARERLLALQNEMQRLKTRRLVKKPVPQLARRMRGAIDLTSINVYLNRNFCIRNIDEDVSYAFVILLKTDEQVEATQTVTLMDTRALRVSKVHFSDQIRFANLPVDFTVLLEIYALKVSENRRSDDYSCSMLKNKAKSLLSPSKKTCGNESVVSCSEFTCCGHICLNRDTVGMQKFYLDGAVYPLEGTIEIESRCTTLPPAIEIDFRGFLTMYQIIAGLGSWARYWAALRRGVVQFWKYPDDEASEKPALACMDLSKCTDEEIKHAPHEICSRPNAFTVDLLVSTSPSLIEKKRVLLSADTKELCNAWLHALNETLEVLRG